MKPCALKVTVVDGRAFAGDMVTCSFATANPIRSFSRQQGRSTESVAACAAVGESPAMRAKISVLIVRFMRRSIHEPEPRRIRVRPGTLAQRPGPGRCGRA